jgi:hypothetical protein
VGLGKKYRYRVDAIQQSGEIAYLNKTCRCLEPAAAGEEWTTQ